MYLSLYGTVLNISRNGTQARTVSLFFLCVWRGSRVSRERVLLVLVAPAWCEAACALLPQLALTHYCVVIRPIEFM